MSYEEEKKTVEVDPATGVPGLLKMVERILELGRVQQVVIERGKVSYARFKRPDDQGHELAVDLASLMPHAVIRNSQLVELKVETDNAAVVVGQLFARAYMDGVAPVALTSGTNSLFHFWHTQTTKIVLPHDSCYGLPFVQDNQLPNEALFLCAAYSRYGKLVDVVRSYKITIPLLRKKSHE